MGLITFTHTQSITVQLPCTRSWALPLSGEVGKFSVMVPYSNPAANDLYINDAGGSLISVTSEYDCGEWHGIIMSVDYQPGGVQIEAQHPVAILKNRPVARNRLLRGVNVSEIAATAMRDALTGWGGYPLNIGEIAQTAPNISEFTFHGEMCWSVLQQLMDWSGAEVTVRSFSTTTIQLGRGGNVYAEASPRNDIVAWGPTISYAYPTLLMAPGTLRNAKYLLDITGQAASAIALDDMQSYEITNAWSAGDARWPAVAVVKEKTDSLTTLKGLAESALSRAQNPLIAVSGDLTTDNWAIREGDTVRAFVPYARFTGSLIVGRVLTRTISDADGLMGITVAVMNESADNQQRNQQPRKMRGRWWYTTWYYQMLSQRGRQYLST
jgi:hypothetical protein